MWVLGQGAAAPGPHPGGLLTHFLASVMGTRLHGTGSSSPDAHGSLDKIGRRGGCSAAWLVRAGSWVTALPDPAGSRATTQALALSSLHLDCCQQVQAREQSNSVLSYKGRGT